MTEEVNILNSYFKDLRKTKPLSVEREKELSTLIQKGSATEAQKAVDELVKSNLRFAVTVARQYQGRGISLEDLINEANLGLIKAAWKFDAKAGFRFITYAVWWIRQSIMESCFKNSRTVRMPLNKIGIINSINKTIISFEQELGRIPSPAEIAEKLSLRREEVETLMNISTQALSLDKSFESEEDGEAGSLKDLIPSESRADAHCEENDLRISLDTVLSKCLNERERYILKATYGFEDGLCQDLDTIAETLHVTPERVRQLRDKAITKIRSSVDCENLKVFLGA